MYAVPRLHLTPALPTAWLIRLVKYRPRRTVSAPSPLHFIIMPLSQLNTMPSIVCSTRLSPERAVEMSPHDKSLLLPLFKVNSGHLVFSIGIIVATHLIARNNPLSAAN